MLRGADRRGGHEFIRPSDSVPDREVRSLKMKRRKAETTSPKVDADTTPLRVAASTGISHALCRRHDRLMVIKPILFFPLLGGFVGLVLMLVGASIYLRSGHPASLFLGGIGTVFAVVFSLIVLLSRRFEFNREGGLMLIRRFVSSRSCRLEEVRAVQLIQGGWHGSQTKFFTYQLNLVLNNPIRSRMNITNTSNWEATWRMGSELAEFLGVPLLDEVSEA
jgi:hypothetical protein